MAVSEHRIGRRLTLGQTSGRPALWRIALALAIAAILGIAIAVSWNPTPLAQALAAIFIACALVHAGVFYDTRTSAILFAICLVISFTIENIGTATGFPFGHYHFAVGAELPHVGLIPVIVGPLWFGAGYFSWVVAATLLGGVDRDLARPFNLIALPLVAAFVLAQWDLVMDAPSSTIAKAWIWHDGGGVFGVPLSNYLGWLFTGWLFFVGFAFYLRWRAVAGGQWPPPSRALRLVAILFYVSAGLTHVVPWAQAQAGEVSDAAGAVWRIHDLRETAVAILIFTMVFTALLALLQLIREER